MRIENSFIPADGVGVKTEQRLWQAGVTHWDEFEPDLVGAKTGESIEEFISHARASLDAGDTRFFAERFPSDSLWRIYENFKRGACYFDIETTGLSPERNEVTTVSLHRDGETTTFVRGQDLTAEALAAAFADASMVVSFNGKRFDQPFLEHEFGVEIDLPHLDLLYVCKQAGLSGGLKSIESELGIGRDGVDIDGREAVRLWHRYEAGDEGALDRLVEYNRFDTRNLETLIETVHPRLRDDVFVPHLPEGRFA